MRGKIKFKCADYFRFGFSDCHESLESNFTRERASQTHQERYCHAAHARSRKDTVICFLAHAQRARSGDRVSRAVTSADRDLCRL